MAQNDEMNFDPLADTEPQSPPNLPPPVPSDAVNINDQLFNPLAEPQQLPPPVPDNQGKPILPPPIPNDNSDNKQSPLIPPPVPNIHSTNVNNNDVLFDPLADQPSNIPLPVHAPSNSNDDYNNNDNTDDIINDKYNENDIKFDPLAEPPSNMSLPAPVNSDDNNDDNSLAQPLPANSNDNDHNINNGNDIVFDLDTTPSNIPLPMPVNTSTINDIGIQNEGSGDDDDDDDNDVVKAVNVTANQSSDNSDDSSDKPPANIPIPDTSSSGGAPHITPGFYLPPKEKSPPPPPKDNNNNDAHSEDDDAGSSDEPPPPDDINSGDDDDLFFEDAPEPIVVTAGGVTPMGPPPKKQNNIQKNSYFEEKAIVMDEKDDAIMTLRQPIVDNDPKQYIVVDIDEGAPIPMSGEPLGSDHKRKHKGTMEMGFNHSRNTTEVIADDKRRSTVLNVNNKAAITFIVNQQQKEEREEEEKRKKQELASLPTSWYTGFIYRPEERPWWMPIDPNSNDRTTFKMRPSHDLTTFDDQLPKNAVTSQKNLLKRQMEHAQQQERIYADNKLNNDDFKEEKEESQSQTFIENDNDVVDDVNDNMTPYNDSSKKNIMAHGITPGMENHFNDVGKVVIDKEIISENLANMNQIMIDYNVIIRKFILFTSIFFVLTLLALVLFAITGFYKWKGYATNGVVLILFGYGIVIGYRSEKYWSFTVRLKVLSYYWLICWVFIFIILCIGILYIVLLPSKYFNYCSINNCSTSMIPTILVTITASLTLLAWLLLIMFYMDTVCRLIIISGKFYDLWSQLKGLLYFVHQECYKFGGKFTNFRLCMARNTGCRLDDLLYCQCWCRYCQRKNVYIITDRSSQIDTYNEWEPFYHDYALQYAKEHKCCRGIKLNCCTAKKKGGNKRRASYDYTGGEILDLTTTCSCCSCFACCKFCENCCQCLEECMSGCCLFMSSWVMELKHATCCGCFCRNKKDKYQKNKYQNDYHSSYTGNECDCCHNYHCDCCDFFCDGEATIYICGCICIGIILLLPIAIYACIASPFWLLAQCITSQLRTRIRFYVVVIVFVIALVPPFILWYLLFHLICDGNDSSGFMQVMCFLWSVINTIYE